MEGPGDRTEAPSTVLVAIEPRTYREVIGKAIGTLRPNLSVKAIESGMLNAEISRTDPMLVLCNGAVDVSVDGAPNWVIFRGQESDSEVTVHLDGRQSVVEKVDLNGLLRIVDQVTSSTRGESETSEDWE